MSKTTISSEEQHASIPIEYKPHRLTYADFHLIDGECFPDEPLDQASFQSFLSQDFWAAWDSGRLAGYCSVQRKPDLAWLRRIAVASQCRRRGIGTKLMRLAVDHCSHIGLTEIILYVLDDNLPAMHLYETFGFQKAEATYQYQLPVSSVQAPDPAAQDRKVVVVPISEVPASEMPQLPRQWADMRSMHNPPAQHVFLFRNEKGDNVGYCRLTPGFPGCFPFTIREPHANLRGALRALKNHLLPEKLILKLTLDDPELAQACESQGYKLNYRLFKMVRTSPSGVRA